MDVLVTFEEGARWRYEDVWDMKLELADLFGRPVDAQRKLVESDEHWLRRRRILESAHTLYAA